MSRNWGNVQAIWTQELETVYSLAVSNGSKVTHIAVYHFLLPRIVVDVDRNYTKCSHFVGQIIEKSVVLPILQVSETPDRGAAVPYLSLSYASDDMID